MPAWNSSSLAFSDHSLGRHNSSGLMKNLSERISKQHQVEHKLFGSKRGMHGTSLKIGKKFRKVGKGILKPNKSPNPGSNRMYGSSKALNSSSISPSTKEFDRMMASISSGSSKNGSRKMFSRKSFG